MIDKYEKSRKYKRVFFHCTFISLIFMVFSFIAKSYYLAFILLFIFVLSLFLYLKFNKSLNKIIFKLKEECIICNDKINYEMITKYYVSNSLVSEEELNSIITSDKKKIIIEKYYCLNCNICYSEIKQYQLNNKNDFVLIKKENHLDSDYNKDKY